MKRKLLCPPESLKIISRTKHVCQDFVLQTKKTLEDTEDIFRPRFPVVQYFINFQRGFETSHYTPFSCMNFMSVHVVADRKKRAATVFSVDINFLLIIASKPALLLRVTRLQFKSSYFAPSLPNNNKVS